MFSGDSEAVSIGDIRECLPLEDVGEERMLGVIWEPKEDVFRFKVRINLSPLKKKSRTGLDLTREDLVSNPPDNDRVDEQKIARHTVHELNQSRIFKEIPPDWG